MSACASKATRYAALPGAGSNLVLASACIASSFKKLVKFSLSPIWADERNGTSGKVFCADAHKG
jgi:hypothetical protein